MSFGDANLGDDTLTLDSAEGDKFDNDGDELELGEPLSLEEELRQELGEI
jgi:hypothetical protein